MDSELYNLEQSETTSARQTVRTVLRFLRLVVRYRLIVLGIVLAAAFIGIVRYKRTPSSYEASARMMIRNVIYTNTDKEHARALRGLLASYKQLLLSDTVLVGSVESLGRQPPELQGAQRSRWPRILRSMLTVSFDPKENIVEVTCRSRDPESTAEVIRAVSTASTEFIETDRDSMTRELIDRLELEQKDIDNRLAEKREALLEARKACGDISTLNGSEETHPTFQRVAELGRQLTTSRSRLVELESTRRTIAALAEDDQDLAQIIPMIRKLVGPDVISQIPGAQGVSPDTILELETALHDVESEILERRRIFGLNHPEMLRRVVRKNQLHQRLNAAHQTNRNRLAGAIRDQQVAQWMINTVAAEYSRTWELQSGLQAEYTLAEQEALALTAQFADVRMAEHDVATLREQYSANLDRLRTTQIGRSDRGISVSPLNQPLVPTAPAAPVLAHELAMSVTLGTFVALAFIYVIDLVDDRLRSPEDVQNQLGIPILGVVRPLPDDDVGDHHIYVHGHPLSVQTECFRTVRTSITLSESETRCLAITSSEQGEGKTTLTSNLAVTFAQTGSRTLLIDADMRRPGLSKLLGIRGQGGLSEILRAHDNVPQMCQERSVSTEVPGLDVLPCGPRMMNAGVLLSMPSLATVLDWAVSEYDQVLVDCPPTLPVSDASIVGNFVDGMLFLLNPEKTHRRSALRAVDQLRSVGMNLIGVVTNSSSEAHAGAYGYGYGYGYGQEYTYGHDEHDDEEQRADAVAGTTFESHVSQHQPYSLLSDAARDSSNKPAADDAEQRAA